MENIRFDAVGGHADDFYYGTPTTSGRKTVLKETTGWEILWYLALHFTGCDDFQRDDPCTNNWFSVNPCAVRFILAVEKLKPYALVGVMFTMPSFDRVSSSVIAPSLKKVIDEHHQEHGEAPVLLCDESCRLCLKKTFVALWDGMEKLHNFDDAYDKKVWGLCLEDATDGLSEPCVMDLKLGFCGFSPFTAEEKKKRIQSRTSSLIRRTGIRVCGTHRYIYVADSLSEQSTIEHCSIPSTQRVMKYKERLRKPIFYALRDENQLACCFQHFFTSHNPLGEYRDGSAHLNPVICHAAPHNVNTETVTSVEDIDEQLPVNQLSLDLPLSRAHEVLRGVEDLYNYFQGAAGGQFLIDYMSFVSSSLLLIFDNSSRECALKVYLIDFARCGLRRLNYKEEDNGFLYGLGKFSVLLQCLLSDFNHPDVSSLKG